MTAGARYGRLDFRMAVLALAVPCIAGLLYLALFGAPASYALINAVALVAALLWIFVGRLPQARLWRRYAALGLIVLLALPLLTGPSINGVARWLSLGGFGLHAGMLTIPLLAVLAASDRAAGAYLMLAATLVAFAQPDAASVLALSLASFGMWVGHRDGKAGAVAALGLFATVAASFAGDLPPQQFVERVIPDLSASSPAMAAALGGALIVSIALIAWRTNTPLAQRLALAGTLTGFTLAALLGNYPYPLIGYGAAAILGFGFALCPPTSRA